MGHLQRSVVLAGDFSPFLPGFPPEAIVTPTTPEVITPWVCHSWPYSSAAKPDARLFAANAIVATVGTCCHLVYIVGREASRGRRLTEKRKT